MFKALTLTHWLTLHGIVTLAALLWYVLATRVLRQRRNPSAAIAWILFILLVPYLALPVFLAFGSRKTRQKRSENTASQTLECHSASWAIGTILAQGIPAPAGCHDLVVHADGREARLRLLEIIEQAQNSLALCTFILGRDDFGTELVERLCTKARNGVRVRLLLDGVGNLLGGRPSLPALLQAGAEYALFAPLLQLRVPGHTNMRQHRKLVIADAGLESARLWSGGRNFAAEYFEGQPDVQPWRDLSFDFRGTVITQAANVFERDWAFASSKPLNITAQTPATLPHSNANDANDGGSTQLVASGPDYMDDTVYNLVVTAAYRADKRIVLVTPYFVPDTSLLMALCLAARRGISVDLLIPARSNHRLSDLARCRALRTLAQAGGKIWLAPGMLHAKLVLIDETLALAGSANLDSRSLFLNFELMFAFHNPADIQRFDAWFQLERIPAQRYQATTPGFLRDLVEGVLLSLAFQI